MSLVSSLRGTNIEEWGAISSVSAPAGWRSQTKAARDENSPQEHVWFSAPDVDEVVVNFYWRGRAVTEASSAFLAALLAQGPHELNKEEITNLRSILGTNNVGNNQHTSFGQRGTMDYPACHLSAAQVVDLNGRPVIMARCTFQDINANNEKEFQGIYFEEESGSGRVQQIYFEAPALPAFMRYLPEFEATLRSISWK